MHIQFTEIYSLRNYRIQRVLILLLLLALVSTVIIIIYSSNSQRQSTSLPSECVRPSDGYLIIASNRGWNDSIAYNASFTNPWPIIRVKQGMEVKIIVCNIDNFAHGFQIEHYYESKIVAVQPGGVLSLSFIADKTGSFRIYCSILCPIHLFMQYGRLIVQ